MAQERTVSLGSATAGYLGEMFEMKGKVAAAKLGIKFGGMTAFVYAPYLYGGHHSSENFKDFWEFVLLGKNPASYLMGAISRHINETPLYGEEFPPFIEDYTGIELPHVYGWAFEGAVLAILGGALYATGVGLLHVEKKLNKNTV